jgi:heptosyltransferase-2
LLAGEDAIADIVWVDFNPGSRRGAHDGVGGFVRLTRLLRARGFGTLIMLHHGPVLAAAARAAGIPDRRGYGMGRQRLFLNHGPFLPPEAMKLHHHTRATHFLAESGIPLASDEPRLNVPAARRAGACRRIGGDEPFVAMGIGSSDPMRRWSVEAFTALAQRLLDAGWPMLVLVGAPDEQAIADRIRMACGSRAERIRVAVGWHLTEVAALLSAAAFYVGNNTGVMNMAAAVGTRTYALFGTTPVFDHARQLVPVTVLPAGLHDGVARIGVDDVVSVIVADRGQVGPDRSAR